MGLSGFGNIMGVHTIYEGFEMWFKDGAFIWVVFVFMAILGVVFLIEPLAAGICVVKGKILLLFSKDENGKSDYESIECLGEGGGKSRGILKIGNLSSGFGTRILKQESGRVKSQFIIVKITGRRHHVVVHVVNVVPTGIDMNRFLGAIGEQIELIFKAVFLIKFRRVFFGNDLTF